MRVQFKTEGGMAHFPGLSQPTIIDSTALAAEEAGELQRLVEAARFFERAERANEPSRGAADYHQYTITVDDGQRQHTVQLTDPVPDQALGQLLHFLQDKARALRRPGR
jgi:hypothetical protein